MTQFINAKELKEQASIIDFLARLGHFPVRKAGREKMYISMIRDDDSNPSFSVNDELGVWFDHGTRKGGNIIDLGMAYWKQLDFAETVIKIREICALPVAEARFKIRPRRSVKIPNYIVQEVKSLGTHPAITEYLKGRGIFEAAKSCLSEVYYYVKDEKGNRKEFFAAGCQNENAGWEVRNKYFKGCLGTKAMTVIDGNPKKAAVFEGVTNYLSWRTECPEADHTILVLNTLSLLPIGINKAKAFSILDVFFDRDNPGHEATKELIHALPYATDRSQAYAGFNDYNDKLKAQLHHETDATLNKGIFSDVKIRFIR